MFSKQIFLTTDYGRYKSATNRDISPRILEEVRQMTERHGRIIAPIIVTKDNVVIDGQHRLVIAKQMNIPIPVYVDENISHAADSNAVDEIVSDVNNYQSAWSMLDHVKHNAARGSENHKLLLEIYNSDELNPDRGFGIGSIIRMATGTLAQRRGLEQKQSKYNPRVLQWEFRTSLDHVRKCIDILNVLERKGCGRKSRYVSAVVAIVNKDKEFNATTLKDRLNKYPRERWEHTSSIRGAMLQLQDVMNYNRRSNRVQYVTNA